MDDAVDGHRTLLAAFDIGDAAASRRTRSIFFTETSARASMPIRRLAAQNLGDRILVELAEETRTVLQDRHLGAGADIDMSELEGDDAAADEDHRARLLALGQDLVRRDHQLRAGDRQRPRLRAGGDDDVLRLEDLVAGGDRVLGNEAAAGRG